MKKTIKPKLKTIQHGADPYAGCHFVRIIRDGHYKIEICDDCEIISIDSKKHRINLKGPMYQ